MKRNPGSRLVLLAAGAALAFALPLAMPPRAGADVVATPGGLRFSYAAPNAGSVALAGSFNDWSTTANPMVREEDGTWSTVLRLAKGTHEYKFVVDGQWLTDPGNPVTMGDYGNSAVSLDDKGMITAAQGATNTTYSTKIAMNGRTIGLYRSLRNPDTGDRFELRRPTLDIDLGFDIRVNDAMDAYVLTNIHNESENIELYRTRLNFDRGYLHYDGGELGLLGWDNFAVEPWGDPLHLVGDVGIYHHAFGFGTQGVTATRDFGVVQARVLYADRFEDGGQGTPAYDAFFDLATTLAPAADALYWTLAPGDDRMRFTPAVTRAYRFSAAANDEDVMAARVTGEWGPLQLGVSGRLDRGYNPGNYGFLAGFLEGDVLVEVSLGDSTFVGVFPGVQAERTLYPRGTEQWKAAGVDATWPDAVLGADVTVEGLFGRAEFVGRGGRREIVGLATLPAGALGSADPLGAFLLLQEAPDAVGDDSFTLDDSWRAHVGAAELPMPYGIRAQGSIEVESHELDPRATGLADAITNRAWTYRADVARDVTWASRRFGLGLGLEAWDFRYDRHAPWDTQLWFDRRNFWLEAGEHEVAYERLLFLGGEDAVFWRPHLDCDVWSSPEVRFEYDGLIGASGFDREPKYVETLLKAVWTIRPRWTLGTDLRFAKYNDPVLDLNDAYNDTFVELKHVVQEGIELALSYGVDPWVLDEPVNEYAYIGRDAYLFGLGANAETARTNYLGLKQRIQAAESAMANARVLQLEAIVRF